MWLLKMLKYEVMLHIFDSLNLVTLIDVIPRPEDQQMEGLGKVCYHFYGCPNFRNWFSFVMLSISCTCAVCSANAFHCSIEQWNLYDFAAMEIPWLLPGWHWEHRVIFSFLTCLVLDFEIIIEFPVYAFLNEVIQNSSSVPCMY